MIQKARGLTFIEARGEAIICSTILSRRCELVCAKDCELICDKDEVTGILTKALSNLEAVMQSFSGGLVVPTL